MKYIETSSMKTITEISGYLVLAAAVCQAQVRTNWGADWQRRLQVQNPPRIGQRQSPLPREIPPAHLCPANYESTVAAPGNCSRFIQCGIPGHGSAYFDCPGGTLYSQELRMCIQTELVDCSNGVGTPRGGIINTQWQNRQNTNRNNGLLSGISNNNNNNGLNSVLNRNNGLNLGLNNRNNNLNNGLNRNNALNNALRRNNGISSNNDRLNNLNRNTRPVVNSDSRTTVELPLLSNNRRMLDTASCNNIQNRLNAALPDLVRAYSNSCKDTACLNSLPQFRVRCSQINRPTNIFTG